MTVLLILGFVLFIVLAYYISKKFNEYTYKRFQYEFFEIKSACFIAASYIALYIAYYIYDKYTEASTLLNAQVLIVLAIFVIVTVVIINIKRTNLFIGIVGSILQLVLYSLITLYFILIIGCAIGSATSRYRYYDDCY
ncbi:hypothetical protein ALC152_22190 [Arcobacter sp. 15-2]|uniref:hypothetical protein n=1 Tax=Arcobacter sp. 15-2 TaxID=3374109 RepID=UPI00399C9B10